MAQEGRPLPAWKRLGLELSTGEQPDHIPQNTEQQPGQSRGAARGTPKGHSPVPGLTENGQSSSLGKRGRVESPAEHHGQTRKKSRKEADPGNLDEPTLNGVSAATKQEHGASEPVPSGPDKSRPKGDPNYRKKKGRRGFEKSTDSSDDYKTDALQVSATQTNPALQPRGRKGRHRSPTDSSSLEHTAMTSGKVELVPSTETDLTTPPTVTTPQAKKKNKKKAPASDNNNTALDSSPARADRRKSVTFTPDTKTSDGNSASNLFKKWVTEQKGPAAEFSPAEVAQFAPPPKLHPANNASPSQPQSVEEAQQPSKAEKRTKKVKGQKLLTETTQEKDLPEPTGSQSHTPADPPNQSKKPKGKNRELYLDYLKQYHTDRANWKFSKIRQNDVLDNALDIFRIPEEYTDALIAYVRSLKSAGALERLKERCDSALRELIELEQMGDASARKAAQEEALGERLEKEKKRRQKEADIETLTQHPHPDGFISRLSRPRTVALLTALNMATPIVPTNSATSTGPTPPQRISRKRKSRTEVSSDESSSSESSVSSSSEEPSSESDDDDSQSDNTGSSSNSSTSGADVSKSSDEEENGSGDSSGSDSNSEICSQHGLASLRCGLAPSPQSNVPSTWASQQASHHETSTTTHTCTILMKLIDLPTELVEEIASQLCLQDFRSFRLVCSSLNHQSLHPFKEVFFQQHTLKWNIAGFQKLSELASDAAFGDAFQKLVIDATPWHAMQLWELKMSIDPPVIDQDGLRLKASAYKTLKEQAESLAKYWNETRLDVKTLKGIFEERKILQSISFAYEGMDKKFGKFGRQYCETSQNEMSRPFVATLTAIATSGLDVGEIIFHGRKKYGAVSIGRLEALSPMLSRFDAAFAHLQSLKINLRDWRHPEVGFEPPFGRAPFMIRFLAKCSSLKSLEISCFSSLEVDLFAEMAKHCRFPSLVSCKLELFRLSRVEDLFEFLGSAQTSLRRLSLSHIVLRDEMVTWSDLMHRISGELELEALELLNLFSRMGARVGIDGTMKGAIILEGPQLSEELEYHAEHLVFGNWGPAFHLASVAYPFIGMRT
ncbi:hypothetical protein K491DRAFT_600295 [Lophiostoma macrostomum CBS 122681]|uniref:F-box domain-containing protein n=1 Tax=Lophiostoma macrostomum CBS 122681 TaxID=1314788 RepID=A0A6A6T6Z4_9PLEO|nr:hypothetical protein K491DRAFT_600295 [Lophiostoma macrostomum CBS 122681]